MDVNQIFTFQMKTTIHHGINSVSRIGVEAKKLGAEKVLIVSDKGVMEAGLIEKVQEPLMASDIPFVVFGDVEVDPGAKTVEKGINLLKAEGCNLVIVVGGGSPICAAKAIALMGRNKGSIKDFEGKSKYTYPPMPLIAVPTTAGAGSEISPNFIITDEKRNYKMSIGGPDCFPDVAILDPSLLINIPFWPAVNAGLDALTHAMEACWTCFSTPLTDSIAMGAIQLILENLPKMVLTGDVTAISKQLLASSMANISGGNARLGLAHALAQPLCSHHLAHGYANGILLPFVMEFNLPACEEKLAAMATAMGETNTRYSRRELAQRAIRRVKKLYVDIGFPNKLDEKDVDPKTIPEMVKRAMTRPHWKFNIRKSSEEDLTVLYKNAFNGWTI